MSTCPSTSPHEQAINWTPPAPVIGVDHETDKSASMFERNLRALARTSPGAVRLLRCATPRNDAEFLETDDGALAVQIVSFNQTRALCSRRRPLREAAQIADQIDISQTAAIALAGFGVGHLARELSRRMRRTGVIIVFEPDIALLRAVLERIDHSAWIEQANLVILTDPDDAAAMSSVLVGVEGIVMMGLSLIEHPACAERLGDSRTRFYTKLQGVVQAVRTMVATTMVQVGTTVRNLSSNIGYYASCPGIADLAGAGAGKPAIVVSAGPSLERNIAQLSRPGVRDRFIIIAAQTVLRQLLARGIRPHFVTALDHSDISARFYEGLSAEDVQGVTLVIEPKASPAIPRAFPGRIRCVQDRFLDMLLGDKLERKMGSIPPGATVAHLAYYLARHMKCDPVVLVGQDLGFTDGQYYSANAAIHDVWAGELNEFNTLEMLEWTRIKRMGAHLRRVPGHDGRSIYTDEQMSTYLVQFERDFAKDASAGLRIIDATEGGVAKRHTTIEPLASVVDCQLAARDTTADRAFQEDPTVRHSAEPDVRVGARLREVRAGVSRVADLSRKAESLMSEMLEHHDDQARVNRLIAKVHAVRRDVEGFDAAYRLVHFLNQTGAFNRIRSDRNILLDDSLTPKERQRREIERDIENLRQLVASAEQLGGILDGATQIAEAPYVKSRRAEKTPERAVTNGGAREQRAISVWGVIALDTRELGEQWADHPAFARMHGRTVLAHTLERVAVTAGIDGVAIITDRPQLVEGILGTFDLNVSVRVLHSNVLRPEAIARRIRSARRWASECWRGGLAGASIFDEVFHAQATLEALRTLNADGALLVGPDWCAIDPAICAQTIKRFREDPVARRLTFSQAAPGLAGCVVARSLVEVFAGFERAGRQIAPIGVGLSYIPSSPTMDAIGTRACITVAPSVRDAGVRVVADSARMLARLELAPRGINGSELADLAEQCVRELESQAVLCDAAKATDIVVQLSPSLDRAVLRHLLDNALPESRITWRLGHHAGDEWDGVIREARERGLGTHVRVASDVGAERLAAIFAMTPDVLSIDMLDPDCCEAWPEPECASELAAAEAIVSELIAKVTQSTGESIERSSTWIVPRLVKCDATAQLIEAFFDRWLERTGAAVIDALPPESQGGRIKALPLPKGYQARLARTRRIIE